MSAHTKVVLIALAFSAGWVLGGLLSWWALIIVGGLVDFARIRRSQRRVACRSTP